MKDLGRLQKTVLDRIKSASETADGAALGVLGPIMGQMDEMHDRWLAMLGAGPTGASESSSRLDPPSSNGSAPITRAEFDVTGHRIRDAEFVGEHLRVSNYKDLLMAVIHRLQALHPNDFDTKARQISGRYPYFSTDQTELRSPTKIERSTLFVETNLNSRLIVEICRRLVVAMGHSADQLKLDVEPVRTRSRLGKKEI
ncbi:hypothetical protein [Candidatus Binatus sp.]|uniref:hypothetical protein n=1 Tax=Candidatus Binatus sp. TaxID=2811406 RepID=UPI003C4B5DCD